MGRRSKKRKARIKGFEKKKHIALLHSNNEEVARLQAIINKIQACRL